ncbi:hypothetical protein NL108_002191, partial [Boleophthalmus pectinirostris]
MVHHREEDLIGIPFPNHSTDVLCSLNEQRRDGLLCDVVLIVQDQEYRTHRSVLAACSQYFKKLFTVATTDGVEPNHAAAVYEIDFVAPDSLTAILDFAYTSTLTITASNVKEILNAAQMLEIPCIINVCLEIMDSGGGGVREEEEEEDEEEAEEDEEEDEEEEEEDIGSRKDEQDEDDDVSDRSESLESRTLKDFSIESLLQEGLYPRMPTLDRRPHLSPLLPGFYPSSRLPSTYPTSASHDSTHPLDLAVKREVIKEEMKEDVPPTVLHGDYMKEFAGLGNNASPGSVAADGHSLGQIKDEADFRSYLNFLSSASHLGALFPPWQLEEERKMKPKASQQCPICNKVIQGAGKLPRHMRTHTGEKPYMCTICEVRFT